MTNLTENRRAFLGHLTAAAGIGALSGGLLELMAQVAAHWKNQIGIELYTVRNLLDKDYEGVLSKLAAMGYKEVDPPTLSTRCSRRSTKLSSISTS